MLSRHSRRRDASEASSTPKGEGVRGAKPPHGRNAWNRREYVPDECWVTCRVSDAPVLAIRLNDHRRLHLMKVLETA